MNRKDIIWLLQGGYIYLYTFKRSNQQWEIRKYGGAQGLHISDRDGVTSVMHQYWEELQRDSVIPDSVYVQALFVYDKESPLMNEACGFLYDAVNGHNESVVAHGFTIDPVKEWSYEALHTFLTEKSEELSLVCPRVDDHVVHHDEGMLSLFYSKGTTYLAGTIQWEEEIDDVPLVEELSPSIEDEEHLSSPKVWRMEVVEEVVDLSPTLEERHEETLEEWSGKRKPTREEIAESMERERKKRGHNYTVQPPR